VRRQSWIRGFCLLVLRPPAIVISFVAKNLYKLLFGWWLDPRTSRKSEQEFADEIRTKLPFLFVEYGGEIIPNESLRVHTTFDYAIVTVAVRNLLLRFVRGRDEFRVDVAPKHDPRDWQEVSLVLTAIGSVEGFGLRPLYYRLGDFAPLIRPRLLVLDDAFSDKHYVSTKAKLSPFHERAERKARELEATLNRKLP
jgi:hypothetical protein